MNGAGPVVGRRARPHPMPVVPSDLPSDAPLVTWRRSARARNVSLRIDPWAGGVVITLPPRAARSAGLDLLRDHAAWVAARLARLPQRVPLADGAVIPIGGVPHTLRHVPDSWRGTWIEDGQMLVSGAAEFVPRRAMDFLRLEAHRRLAALASVKASAAGLAVRRVVVKDTRSRWGSCTADGTLMFSWRLILAPPHVAEYVVAHEVAHLRHMDHGRGFWALVADLTGHRQTATAWLDAHGPGLMRVGMLRAMAN